MASHVFCPNCGSKSDFVNGRKPNFCMSCGHNFTSLAAFGGSDPQPSRQTRHSGGLDVEIDNEPNSGRGRNNNHQDDDAGFSRADIEIEGAPVKIVAGGGNTTRVVDTSRPTLGQFFAHPVPPVEARHSMKASVKAQPKKAFEDYKDKAGGNGLKRIEIGGE